MMTDIAGNPAAAFDFGRLQEMPEDELGTVRDLHQVFLRYLCSSLTIPLRSALSGEILSVDQTTYGAFCDALPSPTSLSFFQNSACETPCVLEMSAELVSPILDLLMGGAGKVAADTGRELTAVEKDLLEKPLGIAARDLTRAWSAFVSGEFVPGPIRTNPRFAGPVGRSESMVVTSMQITIGEASGWLRLAVPASLTTVLRRESEAPVRVARAADAESEQAIRQRLNRELLIDVDCELRGSTIRLKDLLDLKAGTVVDLGVVCDGAITICVNGLPKFNGWLSQAGSRMAVTVE